MSSLGATAAVRAELLAYNQNRFRSALPEGVRFPLADEPFVGVWDEYAEHSLAALGRRLVQLSFPVEAGISARSDYMAATRRGIWPSCAVSPLEAPEQGRIAVYATPAGRIPAIIAGTRGDFVALVQAFTARNEPVYVPESMGACVVAGYNNWDRVQRLRARGLEFAHIREERQQYQDTFLILSSGPYSAVPAEALGLASDEWLRMSLALRAEHEAAHYFTRRVFGSMQNRLMDELVADFYAVVKVFGRFRAAVLLRFFGLENFPAYRAGGRLENYRGDPPLSDGAFDVLKRLVGLAAITLESFGNTLEPELDAQRSAALLSALCRFTVEDLAGGEGAAGLKDAFANNFKGVTLQ